MRFYRIQAFIKFVIFLVAISTKTNEEFILVLPRFLTLEIYKVVNVQLLFRLAASLTLKFCLLHDL